MNRSAVPGSTGPVVIQVDNPCHHRPGECTEREYGALLLNGLDLPLLRNHGRSRRYGLHPAHAVGD